MAKSATAAKVIPIQPKAVRKAKTVKLAKKIVEDTAPAVAPDWKPPKWARLVNIGPHTTIAHIAAKETFTGNIQPLIHQILIVQVIPTATKIQMIKITGRLYCFAQR
jgi:hypothetical protein